MITPADAHRRFSQAIFHRQLPRQRWASGYRRRRRRRALMPHVILGLLDYLFLPRRLLECRCDDRAGALAPRNFCEEAHYTAAPPHDDAQGYTRPYDIKITVSRFAPFSSIRTAENPYCRRAGAAVTSIIYHLRRRLPPNMMRSITPANAPQGLSMVDGANDASANWRLTIKTHVLLYFFKKKYF